MAAWRTGHGGGGVGGAAAPMVPSSAAAEQPAACWTLAIVGLGTFGQFLADAFTRSGAVRVVATSRTDYTALAVPERSHSTRPEDRGAPAGGRGRGVIAAFYPTSAALLEAEEPRVILFATSILSLDAVATAFPFDLVKDGVVIADCCSVKTYPATVLRQRVPARLRILLTHPMFGPNSASVQPGPASWAGLRLVVVDGGGGRGDGHPRTPSAAPAAPPGWGTQAAAKPAFDKASGPECPCGAAPPASRGAGEQARGANAEEEAAELFLDLFRARGCDLVRMSARAHDRDAARTQFLVHFLSRALPLPDTPVDTATYRALVGTLGKVSGNSDDLFLALYRANAANCDAALDQAQAGISALRDRLRRLGPLGVVGQPPAVE